MPRATAMARKHDPARRKRTAARKIGGTTSDASFIGNQVRPQISAISAKAAMRVTPSCRRSSFRARCVAAACIAAGARIGEGGPRVAGRSSANFLDRADDRGPQFPLANAEELRDRARGYGRDMPVRGRGAVLEQALVFKLELPAAAKGRG